MKAYLRRIVEHKAKELFAGADVETVLSWWIANEGRKPVVVVGSGFTRNAVYKTTGNAVEARDVPLWPDLSRRLAEDLRIDDASGIDALSLAEYHRDGMGERRFHDLLENSLKDENLAPGKAHEALFRFRPEAIITTNFLDTLLDRDAGAVPIYHDADAAKPVNRNLQTEVLYLHGHRACSPTWVFTRSQYEDLASTRPVLLTRARQLLSQHPVITVGYSLSDPDFHQVYRQLSLDMKRQQPIGLALLGPANSSELQSEQDSAQRRHWERLGMRIVRFKDWDNLGAKIEKFFQLINQVPLDELKRLIENEKHFEKRVELARSALDDTEADKYIETDHGWQHDIWRDCIVHEFRAEEHKQIDQHMDEAERAMFGDTSSSRTGGLAGFDVPQRPEAPRFRSQHFNERFTLSAKRSRFYWMVDEWLTSRRRQADVLADWFSYRIDHARWKIFPSALRSTNKPDMSLSHLDLADLLSAIWRTLATSQVADINESKRQKARRQVQGAYQLVEKFGDKEQLGRIKADMHALSAEFDNKPQVAPPELTELQKQMKQAFDFAMNGKHENAYRCYQKAFEKAKQGQNDFLTWLAAHGRWDSYLRWGFRKQEAGNNAEVPNQPDYSREYREEVRHYERSPLVQEWRSEADQHMTKLQQHTIDRLGNVLREQGFDTRRSYRTSAFYDAWCSFRELEVEWAPPTLQMQYLRPLIDASFPDAPEELRYRLCFRVDKTNEWLDSLSRMPAKSIEKRRELDQALVKEWLKASGEHPELQKQSIPATTLLACVQTLPAIIDRLQENESASVISFLRKADAKPWLEYYTGGAAIGDMVAKAWLMLGYLQLDDQVVNGLLEYLLKVSDSIATYEVRQILSALLWRYWRLAGMFTSEELINKLLDIHSNIAKHFQNMDMRDATADAMAGFVLADEEAAEQLTGEAWIKLSEWCKGLQDREFSSDEDVDWLQPILIILGHVWTRENETVIDLSPWQKIESDALELLQKAWEAFEGVKNEDDKLPRLLSIGSMLTIGAAYMPSWREGKAMELFERIWTWVSTHWSSIVSGITDERKLSWFLSVVIRYNLGGHRSDANQMLLEIWPADYMVPMNANLVLDRSLWSDQAWPAFVGKLRESLGGMRGNAPANYRIAVCDLVRCAISSHNATMADDLRLVIEQIFVLVANENNFVANHAAYTTIAYAGICPETEGVHLELLISTLKAMAKDVRVNVRHAASYGAARLQRLARSERIREVAVEIEKEFINDTYLAIREQAKRGRYDAEGKLRARERKAKGAAMK